MTDPGRHQVGEDIAWQPSIGSQAQQLRVYLVEQGHLPDQSSADRVIDEALLILRRCLSPGSEGSARTGLICGYVQSGKTMSMTAVSALARDNGYRIVVLLAGVTTNLVEQSQARLERDLRGSGQQFDWYMLKNPESGHAPDLEALVQEWRSSDSVEADRRTLFITVMKHHRHLQNLSRLLGRSDLTAMPALIFDDEADQASLNTRPADATASTTYRRIAELRASLPLHTYLQYTATPQAPLLISRIDSLSADFAEVVSAGSSYTGGQLFFRDRDDLVLDIPPSEIYADRRLPPSPPESLQQALRVFMLGVAQGMCQNSSGHRSMLVHPSQRTATHSAYWRWVNELKRDWYQVLTNVDERHDREVLLAQFRRAYTELASTGGELLPFERLCSNLRRALNRTLVALVNSEDGSEVQWENAYSHVLVGGEKLSRGYTIPGLTVTYMPRNPGGWTADTIQQRARFFGYHSNYIELCRVYLHPLVRSVYVSYVEHEAHMRRQIALHSGRPLSEWKRVFYLDRTLRATRHNVLRTPYLRPLFRDGWFAPRAPHLAIANIPENRRLVANVRSRLLFEPHHEYSRHHLAVVALRDVLENLLIPLAYGEERDAVGLCAVNCQLTTLLEHDPGASCVVYDIDRGRVRERTLANGSIPQLFQGRSSAGQDAYPGDRWFQDPDRVTIHIHNVRVVSPSEGPGEVVPAVAVHLHRQDDIIVQPEG